MFIYGLLIYVYYVYNLWTYFADKREHCSEDRQGRGAIVTSGSEQSRYRGQTEDI